MPRHILEGVSQLGYRSKVLKELYQLRNTYQEELDKCRPRTFNHKYYQGKITAILQVIEQVEKIN